jgi:hypothetical protein
MGTAFDENEKKKVTCNFDLPVWRVNWNENWQLALLSYVLCKWCDWKCHLVHSFALFLFLFLFLFHLCDVFICIELDQFRQATFSNYRNPSWTKRLDCCFQQTCHHLKATQRISVVLPCIDIHVRVRRKISREEIHNISTFIPLMISFQNGLLIFACSFIPMVNLHRRINHFTSCLVHHADSGRWLLDRESQMIEPVFIQWKFNQARESEN